METQDYQKRLKDTRMVNDYSGMCKTDGFDIPGFYQECQEYPFLAGPFRYFYQL